MDLDVRLEDFVSWELEQLGYELVKLEMPVRGRRRIIRLFIDRPDKNVTIDDCVQVTKAIGFVLDGEDVIPGPYNLEVSSPGINRSLTKPAHFQRFSGRTARIEHTVENGKKETLIGTIVESDDETVTLRVAGEVKRIAFVEILKANLHGERWEIPKTKRGGKRHRK
jgi:ribosome maturation factor RimP